MFSTPVKAVLYVLAQALMKLYHMPADWKVSDEHEEFTGADMAARIPADDAPDVGTEVPAATTGRPDQAFGDDAAQAFGADAPTSVYEMTPAANGVTMQQHIDAGWSIEQLLAHGLAVDVTPKPAPSIAVAPPPPSAPVVPTAGSAGVVATSQPAPAPAAGAAPAAPQSGNPVDADNIPWDQRIHSSSRKQNADGRWARRKGISDGQFTSVKAELMQAAAFTGSAPAPFTPIAQQPAAPVVAAPPAAPVAPTPAPVPPAPAPSGAAEAIAQATAAARATAAAKASATPTNFQELMQWVNANKMAAYMAPVSAAMGLAGLGLLTHPENAARVPEAHAHFLALQAS